MLEGIHADPSSKFTMSEVEKKEAELHALGTAFEAAYLQWFLKRPENQTYFDHIVEEEKNAAKERGEEIDPEKIKRNLRNQLIVDWNEQHRERFRLHWKEDADFRQEAISAMESDQKKKEDFFKKIHDQSLI